MQALSRFIANRRRVFSLLADQTRIPVAKIRFGCDCTSRLCHSAVHLNRHYLRNFRRDGLLSQLMLRSQDTAAIIDLSRFAAFDNYTALVARHSNGNDIRMVKKARRLGFETRSIAPHAYARSQMAIFQSKIVRSHGIVTLAAGAPISVDADLRLKYVAPACPRHWVIDKGVFQKNDPSAPMVAFAQLVRSGNLVNLIHFMAHGDYLKQGVAKLLMSDIVAWLLDTTHADGCGTDYLLYGAVEHGGEGAFNWRRYMEFKPFLLGMPRDRRPFVPDGFDAAAYLRRNPDAAAFESPQVHYIYHGAFDDRPYRG